MKELKQVAKKCLSFAFLPTLADKLLSFVLLHLKLFFL